MRALPVKIVKTPVSLEFCSKYKNPWSKSTPGLVRPVPIGHGL